MPNAGGEGGANIIEGALDNDEEEETEEGVLAVLSPTKPWNVLAMILLLSVLVPRSKFNTLTHLDVIKLRNKAKEAPKKPEKAPFFLSVGNDEKKSHTDTRDDETNGLKPKVGISLSSESRLYKTASLIHF